MVGAMTNVAHFSSFATNSRIDGGRGIIFGVSVITAGEAQGQNKGTFIDGVTLTQIAAVGNASADGVPVKLSMKDEHDGSVGQFVGRLINFRVDRDQTRADFELFNTTHKEREFVLELSQKIPTRFGFSISAPCDFEKIDGKNHLRCNELFTVDLVEAPAANPGGLFSAKSTTTPTTPVRMSEIKYKEGTSGEHHHECECKTCMSEHAAKHAHKKTMSLLSAIFCGKADATDAEVTEALTKLSAKSAPAAPAPAKSEAETKLAEVQAELARIKDESAKQVALSKKTVIDQLVAEASAAGKIVPLTSEQLYTEKDGVVTIHTEPELLRTMLSKLPAGMVKMSTQAGAAGTTDITKLDVWDTSKEAAEAFKASRKGVDTKARLTALFSKKN
jgi:hypothetical protein